MVLFEILAAAWFFAFGAVIGSFLNVVVWRTPRGESIVGPSRCPKCGTAIRWYNNVPVFGWLWLGGKCRDCKLPISPRYPVVEFICGAMFLAVALAELAQRGFVDVMLDAKWDWIGTYALHLLLLCALLAWALMQVDEQPIPASQIAGLWLIGLVSAAIWPAQPLALATVSAASPYAISAASSGLLQSVIGFVVGAALAWPISLGWHWVLRPYGGGERYWAPVVALASAGLWLGVQGVILVVLLTCALRMVSLLSGFFFATVRNVPLTMDIFVATLVQICCWMWLAFLPGP